MTSIQDLTPEERKRQREALRRRLAGPGLRPGLVQKWQNSTTAAAKWEVLKAFILDPEHLASLTIESEFVSMSEEDDATLWKEVPLETLRKEFTSPAEVQFLEQSIIAKQPGRPHPQDPTNENMKLYWVYKENSNTMRNKQSIATRTRAMGEIGKNKAARTAVADGLQGFEAGFGRGKGAPPAPASAGGGKDKGKGDTKAKAKPKAGRQPVLHIGGGLSA